MHNVCRLVKVHSHYFKISNTSPCISMLKKKELIAKPAKKAQLVLIVMLALDPFLVNIN